MLVRVVGVPTVEAGAGPQKTLPLSARGMDQGSGRTFRGQGHRGRGRKEEFLLNSGVPLPVGRGKGRDLGGRKGGGMGLHLLTLRKGPQTGLPATQL